MHYLYKEGRVNRAMDANGIQHYNITEKGKQHLAKELKGGTSVIKPLPAPKETIQPRANKTTEAWSNLVEEAEQRGFAKGYEQGVQAAQRAAYEQGKSSVIRKLTEFLS
jgi:flagellar biosynthesis/type III secretory pathway protein FliH